jgi:hypothetical protein
MEMIRRRISPICQEIAAIRRHEQDFAGKPLDPLRGAHRITNGMGSLYYLCGGIN